MYFSEDLIRPLDLAHVAKVSDCKIFDLTQKFIKGFRLFIKQCYYIVWSLEKIQKVKVQKLQQKETEE